MKRNFCGQTPRAKKASTGQQLGSSSPFLWTAGSVTSPSPWGSALMCGSFPPQSRKRGTSKGRPTWTRSPGGTIPSSSPSSGHSFLSHHCSYLPSAYSPATSSSSHEWVGVDFPLIQGSIRLFGMHLLPRLRLYRHRKHSINRMFPLSTKLKGHMLLLGLIEESRNGSFILIIARHIRGRNMRRSLLQLCPRDLSFHLWYPLLSLISP